ncbi:MAG: hypothetical protein KDC27_04465 [Acidobacteria bacterium]|nr:hypothetical protein [Acidobacteriota bacterium]
MSVRARQHIKRMRGGSSSHMLLADDEQYYVVKFRENPQHTRVLVNELICYVLLDYLQLPAPAWEIVEVADELIEASPGLVTEHGKELRPCRPGRHFGSRYPVDPSRQAIYDYVPLTLLRMVVNRETFLGMVAFDKWVSNADGRQAVFFRAKASDWLAQQRIEEDPEIGPRSLVYVANMIDHGFAFNAHHWEFSDNPEQGLYTRREVYEGVKGFDDFEPWLGRILNMPPSVLDDAYKYVPPDWYEEDWDALESLLERLYKRRKETPDLIRKSKLASRDPFPDWRLAAASGGAR